MLKNNLLSYRQLTWLTQLFNVAAFCLPIVIVILSNAGCAILVPLTVATTGVVMADERSLGNVIDDKLILTKIKAEFVANDINHILVKVKVSVMEGRVMLTGSVAEDRYVDEAVKLSWSVKGVREVINELRVGEKQSGEGVNDKWIASQIRTKFLLEKKFNSMNYVIEVNRGVVYLLGIAQSKEELDKALVITSNISGVVKVVNHVILKDDLRRITK